MVSYTDNNYGCKWKPRKVSAKRDFPTAFYDVINASSGNQLVKKHKVCESPKGSYNGHVGPDEGVFDYIPLETETEKETETESSGSCGSGTRGSGNDIVPRFVDAVTCGSDEGVGKLGGCIELKIHGVCLKDIRCVQTKDGLKIELSVDILEKKCVDDESFGNESRACESVTDRVRNERVKRDEEICSKRRLVSAFRSYPLGCGPVMKKSCVNLEASHVE